MRTHPDSVSLVNPPKTMIPNTLAALPSNQYATLLSDLWGNQAFAATPSAIFSAASGALDVNDTDFTIEGALR